MSTRIRDVMTGDVITVQEATPFKAVAELLTAYRIGALPVLDGEERLRGIVSESDLLLKKEQPHSAGHRPLLESPRRRAIRTKAGGRSAGSLMTTPVATIGPDATVAQAARLMNDRKVHHLPVIDTGGNLVGIVSRGDVLRVFVRTDQTIREEIVDGIMIRHLWMDPGQVDVRVDNGVVTLRGQVESRSTVGILVRLVEELDGVVGVDQELTWAFDDTRPVRDPLIRY